MDKSVANRATQRAPQRAFIIATLAIATLACPLIAPAQNCPNVDPNQDYNCPVGPLYALPDWGNVPWSLAEYYQNIVAGDLDGDGVDELIGRDPRGVHVWSFNTALGLWQPWIATDRSGPLVLPLSDALQYNLPQYYSVIRLISFAGQAGKVLAARSSAGLVLYQLVRGSVPGVDMPAGTWTQLTTSGPFADGDCFSNQQCWNVAPYYQTIRFGDIDGEPGDEVIGWGGDGIVAFKWNGSSWANITGLPQAGDPATKTASNYLSLRFADIDGKPGQELLQWTSEQVTALKYVAGQGGGSWTELSALQAFGPPCLNSSGSEAPSCWSTLQAAPFGQAGAAVFIRLSGCNAAGGGMAGVQYDAQSQSWQTLFTAGPFDDCSGFTQPQYYQTIQFARLTGNTLPELIGRGAGGIVVYQWNGTSWNPLSTNVPALADPVWSSDASYWRSILTANADGSGRAALVARGQTGVRTWLWQNGTLARPLPYGGFPPFIGDQATAYNLLNQFLALEGTIRDTYTNPGVDTLASTLRGYIGTIRNARNGCQNEISGNPPQYQTCDPLVGATNPAYTTMVNQVIKELWWAAFVVDHFGAMSTMQDELFAVEITEQGAVFPSLVDNLQLPQASGLTGLADYLRLFAGIASIAGALSGQPEVNVAAGGMNVLASSLAFFQQPQPQNTSLQQTYADIQGQIASNQQAAQTNVLAQKHHVLSDYNLLSLVGQLAASQVWTVDAAGYLSVNRQAFTTWIYQVFLPVIWAQYQVTGCGLYQDDSILCYPPPDGPNMASYVNNGGIVDFTGLLPQQNPICVSQCPGNQPPCQDVCQFPTPSSTTVNVLMAPVSPQCTYNAQAGTAWVYANPSANPPAQGCTLGTPAGIFTNQSGWTLPVVPITLQDGTFVIDESSHVTDLGDAARMQLTGFTAELDPGIDLRTTTLTVRRLLDEPDFGGELVNDRAGNDFVPIELKPSLMARGRKARFETPADVSPHIVVDVQFMFHRKGLQFTVEADDALIAEPLLCLGTPARTKLHLALEIAGGGLPAPRVLSQVEDWQCIFDDAGRMKSLRALGHPVFDFMFER